MNRAIAGARTAERARSTGRSGSVKRLRLHGDGCTVWEDWADILSWRSRTVACKIRHVYRPPERSDSPITLPTAYRPDDLATTAGLRSRTVMSNSSRCSTAAMTRPDRLVRRSEPRPTASGIVRERVECSASAWPTQRDLAGSATPASRCQGRFRRANCSEVRQSLLTVCPACGKRPAS